MQTTINGRALTFDPRFDETALDVIRERAELTGTKLACGGGICGACTVLVNGTPTCSCLMPATHMDGRNIQTIEAHGRDNLHPVQRAFMANEGLQCGFCTPGFINESIAFYDRWRAEHGKSTPSQHDIALAMSGHLCRCAAYVGIYAAIQQACAGDFDEVTELISPRVDALEKVTGEAKYTVDTVLNERQLEGKILRSIYPNAIVKSVDSSAALALDGVIAVADLMEGNRHMRWIGQPIVGVAAVNEQTATAALELIEVEYDILPAAIGLEQAIQPDSPEVWAEDKSEMPTAAEGMSMPYRWKNNVGHVPIKRLVSKQPGKADRQIDRAQEGVGNGSPTTLVEHTYRNAQQVHTSLEPHATVAEWTAPNALRVVTSSQSIHSLRGEISKHFDLELEEVTAESHYIGGGFGGKQGLYRETKAAITLAKAADAPVRVVATRFEDIAYTTLRPGYKTDMSVLTKADGSPEAIRMDSYGDAGVASGTMPSTIYAVMAPRDVPRDMNDYSVVNNTTPGTPFRAPDAPASRWAIEQAVDEAAFKHEIDPVAIRRKWWPNHEIKNRLLDWVETIPQWQERSKSAGGNQRYQRGIGLATAQWIFVYHAATKVTLSASPAGVRLRCATQDIGNGTRTAMAKAVEDAMGISRHDVTVDIGDASLPEGPVSGGSMVTVSLYPTVYAAAELLMAHLQKEAATKLALKNVEASAGGVIHTAGFTPWQEILAVAEPFSHTEKRSPEKAPLGLHHLNLALPIGLRFGHGAIVTEVEVDTRLGKIRPINVWTSVAVGKIHVPELADSQMYSGVIQGLGYALYEKKEYDLKTGHTLSANLNDYRIPGIGDTPEIHIHYDETGYEEVDGKGIGLAELATIGVAASVGNAVYHATGWRPLETPITPQNVVVGLSAAGLKEGK